MPKNLQVAAFILK